MKSTTTSRSTEWLTQASSRLLDPARYLRRLTRNSWRRLWARADYARWSSADGLEDWWVERTRQIASLIPAGSRVIEFGAGQRQLEKLLPENCTYIPSDLVDRGPKTIVCDLNERPLPDLRKFGATVAVFGGVLEYLKDVSAVVQWVATIGIETCVASFDAAPAKPSVAGWVRERLRRHYFGYMNNLTEEQLLQCFESAGMKCQERHRWTTQLIYRFEKEI